ncbi:MAG: hypothetical protein LBI82_07115 [Dysgonamonadaceae bacterium]|jgi:hypothetical protein|nr:hypothetical protein [Dysgonamonadaceae bacterium]
MGSNLGRVTNPNDFKRHVDNRETEVFPLLKDFLYRFRPTLQSRGNEREYVLRTKNKLFEIYKTEKPLIFGPEWRMDKDMNAKWSKKFATWKLPGSFQLIAQEYEDKKLNIHMAGLVFSKTGTLLLSEELLCNTFGWDYITGISWADYTKDIFKINYIAYTEREHAMKKMHSANPEMTQEDLEQWVPKIRTCFADGRLQILLPGIDGYACQRERNNTFTFQILNYDRGLADTFFGLRDWPNVDNIKNYVRKSQEFTTLQSNIKNYEKSKLQANNNKVY